MNALPKLEGRFQADIARYHRELTRLISRWEAPDASRDGNLVPGRILGPNLGHWGCGQECNLTGPKRDWIRTSAIVEDENVAQALAPLWCLLAGGFP